MNKTKPITTKPSKYNPAPEVDMDELAKKWIEMLFELPHNQANSRLGIHQILTYPDSKQPDVIEFSN
jgi:hypothetical protein